MEDQPVNFIDFYDAENLLFEKVGPELRQGIDPSPMYFETLLGWKSERPGDAHWMRLMKISGGTMEDTVAAICADIRSAADDKARLAVLMRKWQFYLPTAVTILVVLYPEFFTMYDVRTRNQTTTEDWSQRNFTDALWKHYCDFKDKVVALTPRGLSLRNADRYLMGKDIYEVREKKLARIARGEGKPRQKRKQQNANANETGAGGPPLAIFAYTIPTEGAPSLRTLQGWVPRTRTSRVVVSIIEPLTGDCMLRRKKKRCRQHRTRPCTERKSGAPTAPRLQQSKAGPTRPKN